MTPPLYETPKSTPCSPNTPTNVPGLAACGVVLLGASVAAPMLGSPLVPVAIALGVALGAVLPQKAQKAMQPGAAFAASALLKTGIVCIGLKLSLFAAADYLALSLPIVIPTMAITLTSVVFLARAMNLNAQFGTLMAAGTAVCGFTAISAVGPAIAASETNFAVAVANVAVFGMIGMLCYPFVAHFIFFPSNDDDDNDEPAPGALSPSTKAGLFLGCCVHDSSQVLGAAMTFRDRYNDPEAFNVATVTKLTRNAFLVAVVPTLALVYAKMSHSAATAHIKRPPILPIFVVGFVAMAALRTTVDYCLATYPMANTDDLKEQWKSAVSTVTDVIGSKFCIGMALSGVGLNTRLSVLRSVGWKPFFVGGAGATIAAVTAYSLIEMLSLAHERSYREKLSKQ
ncbi:hypothetical protein HDU98_000293 [Podochytrium sp. JEL0797]|nr:hypothetical protein HDU98_000293 [Podochytrium sp. JEL0797]